MVKWGNVSLKADQSQLVWSASLQRAVIFLLEVHVKLYRLLYRTLKRRHGVDSTQKHKSGFKRRRLKAFNF